MGISPRGCRRRREGVDGGRRVLAPLSGFRIQLADWKGEWSCDSVSGDELREILGWWKPGEMRWPAPPGARGPALDPDAPEAIAAAVLRFVPLYRFAAWSKESDFLFS